jgi:uncharacterized protein (DUF58 family)
LSKQYLFLLKDDLTNERWFAALVMIFIVGMILRSPYLIALPLCLLVILLLANWWQKRSLNEIIYRRRWKYTRAFPGESNPVRIEIENHKLLPLSWLRIQDPWPKMVGPEDEDVLAPSHIQGQGFLTHVFSLRWFERTQRSYNLMFRKRGSYTVGPAQVESGDLFGIYSSSRKIGEGERLTVFPALIPLENVSLPPENPFGDLRSRRRLFEDPNRPIGVREYHPSDGFRRVHWPATAKTGQLQVKLFQPTSAQVMVLCLNVATYHRYWEGVFPALLEYLLSTAATLLSMGVENDYRVGMISNGCLANSDQPFRIPPGQSPHQLSRLLEALAGVTPVVVAPFDRFLLREIPKVPYGAALVVLSAVITPGLSETLVRLKRHERRITLISLAETEPPLIPGVPSIHLPYSDPMDTLEMQPL